MKKSDFKKGQTVYLFVVEDGNKYRIGRYDTRPFEERIKEATVVSVGSRYITTEFPKAYYTDKERFDVENNFIHAVDCGGANYKLFLSKQDIYDYQEKRGLIKEIRDAFNNSLWFDTSKYTLNQLRRIKEILNENE